METLKKAIGSSTALVAVLVPVVLVILKMLLAKIGVELTDEVIATATGGGTVGYGVKEGLAKMGSVKS